MVADQSVDELREELREVEDSLGLLRQTAQEVRRRIGDRSEGAGDAVDATSAITEAEEAEAVVAALEARRDQLVRRLAAG